MKKIEKILSILTAVAILVLLPETNASTVHADEPVTYAVKYVSDELGWRYQPYTSTFDDSKGGGQIQTLRYEIKDGDLVVVYNDIGTSTSLDLGNVHLSNLTYVNNTQWSMVYAGSVDECYVLGGSTGTINCDVKNAYVYDTVVFNFNGNVEELTINSSEEVLSSIGCKGTVGHLYAYAHTLNRHLFNHYDFVAGALLFDNGVFKPQGNFKTADEHAADVANAANVANSANSVNPTENTTAPSDEYDDVPKTGQSNLYLWLLFASVVCFAGSRALKRSVK